MSAWNPLSWFSGNSQAPQPPTTPEGYPGPSRGLLDLARRWLGGWLGPMLSADTPAGEDLSTEKVASGPRGVALLQIAPYIDDVTAEPAAARLAYRQMWANAFVKAALLGKINAVMALDLKVQPPRRKAKKGDREVADFVQWALTERLAGGFPGLAASVLTGGLVDGHSASEKVWGRHEKGRWAGKWVLRKLKPKRVNEDLVPVTDQHLEVIGFKALRYNAGEVIAPSRFLYWRNQPLYDSATGTSDLRAVYGPWWRLDTLQKLRVVAAEKRSVPWIWGTYRTRSQKEGLEDMLANVKSQTWGSVPEGVKVELLDLAGSADHIFQQAIEDAIHEIFLGLAGAMLQALEGTVPGGRGSSRQHRSTADLFVWALSASVQALLNDRESGLVSDIVDLNYAVDEYPIATLGAVDIEEQKARMEIHKGASSLGVELSKAALYEEFNITPPDAADPDDALQAPGGGPQAPEGGGGQNPILAALGGGGDPDDVPERLEGDEGQPQGGGLGGGLSQFAEVR